MSNNPFYLFFRTPPSFAPLFLRLALTAVFLYQGGRKMFGWFGGDGWHDTIAKWTNSAGFNVDYFLIAAAIVGEVIISVIFFFGFLTRLAAFMAVLITAGSLYYVQGGQSFESVQFPLMVLSASLALLFIGGGHLSIDRSIGSNLLPYIG